MPGNDIAPKGERPTEDEFELLNTEGRVLEYLRTVMLESGDDPSAMAVAIDKVEAASARLRRRDPLQGTNSAIEMNRRKAMRRF